METKSIARARPNVLTVDLEDWFHCLEPDPGRWQNFERRATGATEHLLELLDARAVSATFFVLGDVARHSPSLVRRVAAAGHEIGSHGMEHRMIYEQSRAAFRADLRCSLDLLGDLAGSPVVSFRAPYFSITSASLWAFDVLAEEGVQNDSSVFPVRNHRYGIPAWPRRPAEVRCGLTEWPIACVPTAVGNLPCCGGVYLRLLPWLFTRWAVSALERRGDPIVAYLHPWELDAEQPRAKTMSAFLRFRHYRGLAGMQGRLLRLLELASFTSISHAALME